MHKNGQFIDTTDTAQTIFVCIKYLLFLCAFFTPLIFTNKTEEVYEFPKMIFIYLVAATVLFLFFVGEILIRENSIKGGYETFPHTDSGDNLTGTTTNMESNFPADLQNVRPWTHHKGAMNRAPTNSYLRLPSRTVLLLLGTTILSTLFSMHANTSFWGYYSRFNGGLASLIAFTTIYYVIKNTFNTKDFDFLLTASFASVFPISIYALYQWISFATNTRVYSTYGQPNWLATYFVMLIPYGLYKLFQAKTLSEKLVFFTGVLLSTTAIIPTYSLSGILGLTGALLTYGVLWMFSRKSLGSNSVDIQSNLGTTSHAEKPAGIMYVLGIFTLTIFLLAITHSNFFTQRINDVYLDIMRISANETQTSKTQISDPGFIRLYLWRDTWNLITSNAKIFFIGTGPETFPYAFQPFRSTELNYSSEWDFIFNKPHNYYLETWSEEGLLGIVVYIILFWDTCTKLVKKKHIDRAYIYIIPALIGFAITNIFSWPVVYTSFLFWIFVTRSEINPAPVT